MVLPRVLRRLEGILTSCDKGMAKEWSAEPLEIPLGLMTQARAKRFKEALNVLIQDVQVEGAYVFNSKEKTKMVHEALNVLIQDVQVEGVHVFNSKEETKMVHVIKVNPDLDQDLRRF